MKFILLISLLFFSIAANAQVGVGTNTPASSAMLDVTSTNKGFLPPRFTNAQRGNIINPEAGLIIYNTDEKGIQIYNGTTWYTVSFESLQNFSTTVSAFQPTGCQALATATTTYQKIGDMGTFTKNIANSFIELNLQTNLYVGSFTGTTGVIFELRVDGVATSFGRATALLRTTGTYEPITIIGAFSGLSAGSHTVSLWAKSIFNTATNIMWDNGCFNLFGTNNVLVKEFQ